MSKDRKHGNREAKKPKVVKAAVDPNSAKLALGSLTPIKPPKNTR